MTLMMAMVVATAIMIATEVRYNNEQYLVYYRMRYYTSPRVFPHAGIHISVCTQNGVNPHLGFTHYRLHFRMWKFT